MTKSIIQEAKENVKNKQKETNMTVPKTIKVSTLVTVIVSVGVGIAVGIFATNLVKDTVNAEAIELSSKIINKK